MSRLGSLRRRWRWSLTLALLLTLVSAAVVFAILLGGATGTWSNAVPQVSATESCLSYDNGQETGNNRVFWGRNSSYDICLPNADKSAYGFDGIDTQVDVPPEQDFLLGTFTHYNFPIRQNSSITGAQLSLGLPICGTTKTFPYLFGHDETVNTASPCAYGPGSPGWPPVGDPNANGCADRVALPGAPGSTAFDCGSGHYTVALTGFIPASGTCPASPGSSTSQFFYTAEGATNIACVYGRITAPSTAVTLADLTAASALPAAVPLAGLGRLRCERGPYPPAPAPIGPRW